MAWKKEEDKENGKRVKRGEMKVEYLEVKERVKTMRKEMIAEEVLIAE